MTTIKEITMTKPSVGRGGTPHPVDVHVGAKLRTRRHECGVSQETLGKAIGLTFQQVQKYERGTNRVSCSVLVQIAKALDVSPGYFIDDAPDATSALPARDGWSDAQRIIATVSGAMEALYCLDAVDGSKRAPLVAGLQIACGRWTEASRKAAAA